MSNETIEQMLVGFDVGSGVDSTVIARRLYGGQIEILKCLENRPPKYRRMREVHAQRARKLRRRGEYVHFLRWDHGHCIYGWGGPIPETFYIRMPPR